MQSATSQPQGPAPPPSSSQGEILPRQFGKYTLLRELATGGMAKVYLALQRAVAGFEKLVVLKRILPELARDRNFVEMLLAEARTAATLNHANVVQTFDVGEWEGTYYIAMEHINGEDIRSIVRAMKRKAVTEFPLEHTLNIILGTCAGLSYAHEKRGLDGEPLNIVHRDVSPQNILVTFTGDVKLVDFGIAKSSQEKIGEHTSSGQLKGKVPYMSPEQASGNPIDHRSDIFAVGVVLFELTTGRRLFKAKSDYETLKLICDREYPRPGQVRPGYPLGLEAIVMRALAKNPAQRYQNARDMQADLEAFIRHERIAVSSVSLANWMRFLFEEKIAQQKEALQDVKQLADVIASQHSEIGDIFDPSGTTTGASTVTGTDIAAFSEIKRRQRRSYLVFSAIILALLVGGGAVFWRLRRQAQLAQSTTTSPVTQTAEPEAKRGKLSVDSVPPGAYIRLAGELQGAKTPATLEKLPLGMEIEVKISLEGYEDYIEKTTLSEEKLAQAISVKLVKGTVTLVFDVLPAGAAVVLDDKPYTGKGNKVEELSTGEHKVMFSAPGHIPQLVKWTAKRGETKKLEIRLVKGEAKPVVGTGKDDGKTPVASKGTGTVNVNSTGGYCTQTIVAGRSVGPTPVAGISVPAGPVSVTCKTADGRSFGGGGTVEDGKTARITIRIQ